MKNGVSTNRTIHIRVLVSLASFLFIMSGAMSAQAGQELNTATLDHPSWVQIPGELIRPDCIHEIPNGATVEIENGQITGDVTLNGVLLVHYDACPEDAVITRPRGRTENLLMPPGVGNGWVEASQMDVSLKSSDDIDNMSGNWTVPSDPKKNGALIYLFNGIEPSSENWILQPVLQYGSNGYFGGNYWVIASWLVGPNNYAFYSGPVTVHPGDSLHGYTKITSESGGTLYWKVQAKDTTTGGYSWITAHTSGLHWTWAFAAVLEAYNVTSCSEFPANGKAVFTASTVDHGFPSFNPVSPSGFYAAYYSYGGPSCSFSVNPGATSTLKF